MITSTIHKMNDRYVVEIPKDEVERLKLEDGQRIGMELTPLEVDGVPDDELREVVAKLVQRHREALDYLAQ